MKWYTHLTKGGRYTATPDEDNAGYMEVVEFVDAHREIYGVPVDYFNCEFEEISDGGDNVTISVPLNREELHFLSKLCDGDEDLSNRFFEYYERLLEQVGG